MRITTFGQCSNLLRKCEMFIKYKTNITSGMGGIKCLSDLALSSPPWKQARSS